MLRSQNIKLLGGYSNQGTELDEGWDNLAIWAIMNYYILKLEISCLAIVAANKLHALHFHMLVFVLSLLDKHPHAILCLIYKHCVKIEQAYVNILAPLFHL
jgi:hypothetical protein